MKARLTPEAARVILHAVVRQELRAAWDRGLDSAPHGVNSLADAGAPGAFREITLAADAYAAAVARHWKEQQHHEH
jgi:hypothetical protein